MMLPDISEIGEFTYSWDFDEEEYDGYLDENGLSNTKDELYEYIRDYVSFDMEFLDKETFHTFQTETMTLDEIEEEYGEKLANTVLDDCMRNGEGRVESYFILDTEVDVNNPSQLNDMARKLLRWGEYQKDCRGFILSDGTVVYTPNEHNECTIIDGVKNTFHFISLGNIRVLPNSIDIGKAPTKEQRGVLRNVISSYSNDELYLDIFDNGKEIGTKYNKPNWRFVMGEIDRYYRDGIRPSGQQFLESRKCGKTIVISEETEQNIIGNIIAEAFYPAAEKVIAIKDYMDKNFARQELDSIDMNGYPTKEKTVVMLSKEKQPLKTLNMKELLRMLDDKFHGMISDDSDRKRFIKQVIRDWYFKRIKDGILSVNRL